jgi:hypothetical protein
MQSFSGPSDRETCTQSQEISNVEPLYRLKLVIWLLFWSASLAILLMKFGTNPSEKPAMNDQTMALAA